MSGRVRVDVQVAEQVAAAPDKQTIARWLRSAIRHAGSPAADIVEVSVRVVGEEEGRKLNLLYREKDHATNVLSFRLLDDGRGELPAGPPLALGDIVICEPVVRREAAAQGLDAEAHWAHMLVHGALHLLGYDHDTDADARRMEALESRILGAGGVADPYADAAAGGTPR